MAEINKVGLNLGQKKIANPFKTSRNSTTNPFKYSNFEGNTLQFADVFEGFEQKKGISFKGKMISSSVVGSMTKLRSGITEPIIKFVNRIREGASNAWAYTKRVSELAPVKAFNDVMRTDIVDLGKGMAHSISDTVSGVGNHISQKTSYLHKDIKEVGHDVVDFGKDMLGKWSNLVSKINVHSDRIHIPAGASPELLRELWIGENDKIAMAAERVAA